MEKTAKSFLCFDSQAIHKDFIFARLHNPHAHCMGFGTLTASAQCPGSSSLTFPKNPPISKGDAIMMYLGMLPLPRRKFHQ